MDHFFTIYSIALEIFIQLRKEIMLMKKTKKFTNTVLMSVAAMFVAASHLITTSGSLIFVGEPKCPKDLLK